jgi:hypothetical protein
MGSAGSCCRRRSFAAKGCAPRLDILTLMKSCVCVCVCGVRAWSVARDVARMARVGHRDVQRSLPRYLCRPRGKNGTLCCVDGQVPAYTFLRQNRYIGRMRNQVLDEDIMVCQCDDTNPCGEGCMNRDMFYECLRGECKVKGCRNQRFRQRQYAPLEVFHTPGKGYGLRCTRDLGVGEFVSEYCGEVVSTAECKRRTQQYDDEGDEHFYFMTIDADNVIDASRMSNLARFMNHSCEPNCVTQKWNVDGEVSAAKCPG